MSFLQSILYHDIYELFGTFFDNEPIEGRNCNIHGLFNLEIINVEETNVYFEFSMPEFASFIICMDLEQEDATIVAYNDSEENSIIIDTDIGGACREIIKNRLYFALSFFEDNIGTFDELFENVEVFDSIEKVKGLDTDDISSFYRELYPKEEKKIISVDMGLGMLITRLVEKGIVTLSSCIGHGYHNSFISLYCLEEQIEEIKQIIDISCTGAKIEVEEDKENWLPMEDGRKHYMFSWE